MWQNVTPMILLPYMGKGASQVAQWWKIHPPMQERETQGCKRSGVGSIPGSGRSTRVGNDNLLQYFCLENSLDRVTWWATVHGVAKSDTSEHTHTHMGKGIGVALPWLFKTQSYYSAHAQILAVPSLSLSLVSKKQAINNMDPIVTRKLLQHKDYNYKQQLKNTQKLILS